MAVRGGFGVFPDCFNDDIILQHVELPPLVNTLTANYTTIRELLATPLSLSPAQARTLNPDYQPQYTYNYSIGVQRDLGWNLVGDFSYVGSKGRNLLQTRNINAVPYGTNFLASSIDPTTAGALPNVFLRPYRGYQGHPGVGVLRHLELRRVPDADQPPLHRRLPLRRSYTFAKTKNVGIASPPNNNPTINAFLPFEARNYGDTGRRHNLAIDYSYQVPNLSSKWNSPIAKVIGDGWEISGVTSALSGAALGMSYTVAGVSDLTGGAGAGVDSRVEFICDPNLSRGDRTSLRAFATECVAPPSPASNRVGSARGDELIGPGYLNWDFSFIRNIPLGGTRRLQFRTELYNAFNNVQFSTVNTGAVFNAAGEQTNAEFGQYTAARPSRRVVFTLRALF